MAIDLHMTRAKYVYTLRLLRWFGTVKNSGKYNNDGFLTVV